MLTGISYDAGAGGGLQDAARGDHMEIIALLQKYSAKVKGPGGQLVEYRIFNVKSLEEAITREWEIDPADIKLGEKIGEGECVPALARTHSPPLFMSSFDQVFEDLSLRVHHE